MKPGALIGIVLILLGVTAVAHRGSAPATRDTAVVAGPLKATEDPERTLPFLRLLGGAVMAGGIVFLIVGVRKRPVF